MLRRLALSGFALALACALPAAAQSSNKPFRLQTALDAPDWLSISGSIRLRYETLADQFTAGRTGDDEMLATQGLLKIEAHRGAFAAGIELLDARRWVGDAGGAAPGETDALEPIQAYVAWRPDHVITDAGQLDLTLGRFTMDAGSRRLIARPTFRYLQQSYTGARAVWSEKNGPQVTVFYTAPTTRLPSDTPSALDNEIVLDRETGTRFGGLLVETPLLSAWGVTDLHADAYAYDLDEDDAADIPTRNRKLTTYGVRLRRAPKADVLDFELEAAQQDGHARATTAATDTTNLDIDAHMLHAEAGFTFDVAWSPRLALVWDMATGDRNPADAKIQRFDPLFGDRRFDLGPTSLFGAIARTNFNAPGLRLEAKPDALSDVLLGYRVVRLDAKRDAFANSNVRDASGLSGDHAGEQLEARYRRWLLKDALRLDCGAAWFREGRFLKDAPNATRQGDPLYGYVELQWTF